MGKKLAVNVTLGDTTYPAGSEVPDAVATKITNPKAWGEDTSSDDGSEATSYKSMKIAELKAEIDNRNEYRNEDDQLSTEGNKADLVAVLEADDASGA